MWRSYSVYSAVQFILLITLGLATATESVARDRPVFDAGSAVTMRTKLIRFPSFKPDGSRANVLFYQDTDTYSYASPNQLRPNQISEGEIREGSREFFRRWREVMRTNPTGEDDLIDYELWITGRLRGGGPMDLLRGRTKAQQAATSNEDHLALMKAGLRAFHARKAVLTDNPVELHNFITALQAAPQGDADRILEERQAALEARAQKMRDSCRTPPGQTSTCRLTEGSPAELTTIMRDQEMLYWARHLREMFATGNAQIRKDIIAELQKGLEMKPADETKRDDQGNPQGSLRVRVASAILIRDFLAMSGGTLPAAESTSLLASAQGVIDEFNRAFYERIRAYEGAPGEGYERIPQRGTVQEKAS